MTLTQPHFSGYHGVIPESTECMYDMCRSCRELNMCLPSSVINTTFNAGMGDFCHFHITTFNAEMGDFCHFHFSHNYI